MSSGPWNDGPEPDWEAVNVLAMHNHIEDLTHKVEFLLEHGYTYGEDGAFCFPDGDIWHRPSDPHPSGQQDRTQTGTVGSEYSVDIET